MMPRANKQELPSGTPPGLRPGLWVVATPIGNLSDISERAIRALGSAERIYCEDTRQAAKLLSALGLPSEFSRLERLDAHAAEAKLGEALEFIEGAVACGAGVALITDAGTPAISDPGARLVALAHDRGVRITPVPGASALATLLSVSGFEGTSFAFRGFFPRSPRERKDELILCASSAASRIYAWFESPHRISGALQSVAEFDPMIRVVVAKELTKIHERIFHGEATQVLSEISAHLDEEGSVGEWAFVVQFAKPAEDYSELSGAGSGNAWEKALACLLDAQVPASEAARQVSQHFGEPKNRVYQRALELGGKKTKKGY